MRYYLNNPDKPHNVKHTRKNGDVVFVTVEHYKRIYKRGDAPPNYHVPAICYPVFTLHWILSDEDRNV